MALLTPEQACFAEHIPAPEVTREMIGWHSRLMTTEEIEHIRKYDRETPLYPK